MQLSNIVNSFGSLLDSIPGIYEPQADLETDITRLAMRVVTFAALSLLILTIFAILFSSRFPRLKLPIFVLMTIAMVGSTLTLIGSTVYLNLKSESGGPIHWHADIEYWACDNELEIRDPTGFLSNKIGTSVLHEHDDHRIHLEGVAVEKHIDASLGKFMHVIGGGITDEALVLPLNAVGEGNTFEDDVDGDGPSDANAALVEQYIIEDPDLGRIANFRDGDACGDEVSDVQVYVYKYNGEEKTYTQEKVENPRDYVIEEDPNVPPGDCIIVEFGPTSPTTDKLCEQYGIRDIERCERFGVSESQREICELTQIIPDVTVDTLVPESDPEANEATEDNEEPSDLPADTGEEISNPNDPEVVVPTLAELNSHVCSSLYDALGTRNETPSVFEDVNGAPLDPDAFGLCDDYLKALSDYNTAQGVN